jgi:tripartite-type tricarboxylate transporter receptor subunit TctC
MRIRWLLPPRLLCSHGLRLRVREERLRNAPRNPQGGLKPAMKVSDTVGGTRGRGVSSPLLLSVHLALFAVTTAVLGAPSFPTKPIRMMVATAIGSGPDVVARMIGSHLAEAWGQQVVVDTRPGASGLIGAELVAKAAPDGYTLWMATTAQLISTTMYQRFLIATEFAPVSMVASTPYVIAVSASLPVKSIAELIAYAKARPGQVMYGSGGQGTTSHLCMELFQSVTGIKLVHVPYKSTALVLTDMIGGQMHITCAAAPVMPPFAQGGRVRSLGVTTRTRTMLAPDLQPIAESVPGFELIGWFGVVAPLGTPKEIIAKINLGVAQALKSPEIQKRLIAVGAEAAGSTPAEFGVFLRNETMRWGRILRESNIRPPE